MVGFLLKFVFSKAGLVMIAIFAILSAGAFIKFKLDSKQATIDHQQKTISTMRSNEATLKSSIEDLNDTVGKQRQSIIDYDELALESNLKIERISRKLQESRSKMQSRNLSKLRESSHNELVLKIINKSTQKQIKGWNDK